MSKKVTWEDIYNSFKSRHSILNRDVLDYKPRGYCEIDLWMSDGSIMKFNDMTGRVSFTKRRWMRD